MGENAVFFYVFIYLDLKITFFGYLQKYSEKKKKLNREIKSLVIPFTVISQSLRDPNDLE